MPERSVSASGYAARSPEIPGHVSADVRLGNETAKIRILARPLDNLSPPWIAGNVERNVQRTQAAEDSGAGSRAVFSII